MFHWGTGDFGRGGFDAEGHTLWWANAWVMAAARKLLGPASANVSVLLATAADGGGVSARPAATLARRSSDGDEQHPTDVCANITASGIGGPLPTGTGVRRWAGLFTRINRLCSVHEPNPI